MVNKFFMRLFKDGSLIIPPKFVRTNARSLKDSIEVLEARDREKCGLKLHKHGGKVWFGKGWKDFANHYSIKLGHFLVFKYEENSGHFRVDIFDEIAMEVKIDCRFTNRIRRSTSTRPTEEEQPPLDKRRKATHTVGTSKGREKKDGASKAVERAEAFRSRNPFFWVLMKQVYALGRYMNMPRDFGKKYLEGEAMNVIFRNSEEGEVGPSDRTRGGRNLAGKISVFRSWNLINRCELEKNDLIFGFRGFGLVGKGGRCDWELTGIKFSDEPPWSSETITVGGASGGHWLQFLAER
nr:putative B3 domain-containing protein Os03g0621600 [Ziziphus jujuba var. spinosa]